MLDGLRSYLGGTFVPGVIGIAVIAALVAGLNWLTDQATRGQRAEMRERALQDRVAQLEAELRKKQRRRPRRAEDWET